MARQVRLRRQTRRAARGRTRRLPILAVVLAVLLAAVPMSPAWVERWFSTGIYAAFQPLVSSATSLVPVALLDLLLLAAVVWVALAVVRVVRARGRRLQELGVQLWRAVVLGAAVYVLFLGMWGLNYRRLPITSRLDYSASRVTSDAVTAFAREAVRELNRLHPSAHAMLSASPSLEAARLRLAPAFAQAQRAIAMDWTAAPARPKHPLVAPFFRWAGVDGMINPLGLEVLLNPGLLPVERPAALAHEWAHLAGWARESEASYLAWLACRRGDEAAQYSGWLALYWYLRADLPPEVRGGLERELAAGPRGDLNAIAARVTGPNEVVQQASWRAYDKFLKVNRVQEGIESYSEVVRLVVGTKPKA
ncbi:MAG TPA: DUF3810 family protein [Vicinamibacterales bacterium]